MRTRKDHPIQPVACRQIEITEPIPDLDDLDGYHYAHILARFHGWPLPAFELPVLEGRVSAAEIRNAVVAGPAGDALAIAMACWLETRGAMTKPGGAELTGAAGNSATASTVSIVVCTRDRASQLKVCLDSLRRLDPQPREIIIVDNAPSDDSTEILVCQSFPEFSYVREARPGLDWARNAGACHASGEIVAFTDDDVAVDPGWAAEICDAFDTDPSIKAVTGLVEPAELETIPQQLFEHNGGFGRGYYPVWTRVPSDVRQRWEHYGTGQYGTGANIAFRRAVFDELGGFDPALDVGTATNGGGDLEMLARVLAAGHVLCYWPAALVFHYHRRDYVQLYRQLENNGRGFLASLIALWLRAPTERPAVNRIFAWWAVQWLLLPSLRWLIRRGDFRGRLRLRELKGALLHPLSYRTARRRVKELAADSVDRPGLAAPKSPAPRTPCSHPGGVALREIDLECPVSPIEDAREYDTIDILVRKGVQPLGSLKFTHNGRRVSVHELALRLTSQFSALLFEPDPAVPAADSCEQMMMEFRQQLHVDADTRRKAPELPGASIVLPSLDRPELLKRCLDVLFRMKTAVRFEVIVVDNNPDSGLTEPVVRQFPRARYTTEPRRGLSYARNAGIRHATRDVVVCVDDDVLVADGWLDNLCRPFLDSTVAAVTGNVLPASLDNASARQFEAYGGLGRGFEKRVFDYRWLCEARDAPPTWNIGATANAAFRSNVFTDNNIGLLDEGLGPGMPSGVGEDTYLFYRILRAGHRIVYEPSACVRHEHRVTTGALRHQLFAYSRGHVAYLLTTWLRGGDRRALRRLLVTLPIWHVKCLLRTIGTMLLLRKPAYPLGLVLLEIYGNLLGPFALLLSRRRVRRLGRSGDSMAGGVSYLSQRLTHAVDEPE